MFTCFIFISVVIHERKCFLQRLFWENLVNNDEPYRQENSYLTYEDKKYLCSFIILKQSPINKTYECKYTSSNSTRLENMEMHFEMPISLIKALKMYCGFNTCFNSVRIFAGESFCQDNEKGQKIFFYKCCFHPSNFLQS